MPQALLDHTVEQPIQKLFIPLAYTCMSSTAQTVLLRTEGLASVFQLLKKVNIILQYIHSTFLIFL